ncbi:hypothetical protein [Natronosalvus vescus]|uniref:hypothetical protein n=1 Tax=Natronosalvus vescus TaxID=2953881 RepID=UPI0020918205|nr:hypothetical protein [Natronosalvus vescus]
MPTNRAVVCLALLAVIGLLVAPVAATGGMTDEHDTDDESQSVSDEVSTFMQANTANAAHTVDDGIFTAKFEKGDDDRRAALIEERTAAHESKLEELEAEYQELREQRDDLHPSEYNTRMTRITVELAGIDRSLEQTEQRARGAGVNVTELNTLRQNASELGGQEVAERAQQIAGVDPPRGPPDDAGPGEETPGQNDSPGVDDNQTGENQSNNSGNDSAGPPDDTPNASGDGDGDGTDDNSSEKSNNGDEAKESEKSTDDNSDGDDGDESEPDDDDDGSDFDE